jgi:hypothetical protein
MHMIWQIQDGYVQDKIQQRFLKFTARQMEFKALIATTFKSWMEKNNVLKWL